MVGTEVSEKVFYSWCDEGVEEDSAAGGIAEWQIFEFGIAIGVVSRTIKVVDYQIDVMDIEGEEVLGKSRSRQWEVDEQ